MTKGEYIIVKHTDDMAEIYPSVESVVCDLFDTDEGWPSYVADLYQVKDGVITELDKDEIARVEMVASELDRREELSHQSYCQWLTR